MECEQKRIVNNYILKDKGILDIFLRIFLLDTNSIEWIREKDIQNRISLVK